MKRSMSRFSRYAVAALAVLLAQAIQAGDLTVDGNLAVTTNLAVKGNVGIGTNAPAAKLHVAGNTRVDTNLTVGGTISEGGIALASKYLPVSGGTMTGDITLGTVSAPRYLRGETLGGYWDPAAIKIGPPSVLITPGKSTMGVQGTTIFGTRTEADGLGYQFRSKPTGWEDTGDLIVGGSISEGGTALASKYLALAGGTMFGNLTVVGGNVGIGTNVPGAALHVVGTARFDGGISCVAPQGNLGMGSFTNRPAP